MISMTQTIIYTLVLFATFQSSASAEWLFQDDIHTCFNNHRTQVIDLDVEPNLEDLVPAKALARHGLTGSTGGMNKTQFSFRAVHNGIGPLVLGPFTSDEESELTLDQVRFTLAQELCMDHPLCQAHFFTYRSEQNSKGQFYTQISRLLCAHQTNIEQILNLKGNPTLP